MIYHSYLTVSAQKTTRLGVTSASHTPELSNEVTSSFKASLVDEQKLLRPILSPIPLLHSCLAMSEADMEITNDQRNADQ